LAAQRSILTVAILSGTFLATFTTLLCRSQSIPRAQPAAVLCVAKRTVDLGHTTAQKEWKIGFPIRNAGTRRLVLNELDPDCNCGDRARQTTLVPPGATAEVTVTLDTRFASGPIETTARFTTSVPAQPALNLTVRAWVDAADYPGRSKTEVDAEMSILSRH